MGEARRDSRRIISTPPPGNDAREPREHETSKCLPHRKGKPHAWEIHRDGFGEPTGRMFCLWCKKTAPMKKSTGMFVPTPACANTGY